MKKITGRKTQHVRRGKGIAPRRSRLSRRGAQAKQLPASDVTYEVVQHDGGWAYKVNGAFSEAFPTHAEALAAAQSAATEQELPGDAETIGYEDDRGEWHSEMVSGRDRPHVVVKDTQKPRP